MRLRALALLLLLSSVARAGFGQQVVLIAAPQTPAQVRYLDFLREQLAANGLRSTTLAQQQRARQDRVQTDQIVVGTHAQMPSLLAPAALRAWRSRPHSTHAEGFDVLPWKQNGHTVLILSAAADRGELFAIGWLLRSADRHDGVLHLPMVQPFTTEPDPVYALTEGREPIDPRPAAFQHIYRHFYTENNGFIVYSEGVNDDVNKVLWGSFGWNKAQPAHATLQDYARYFFHSDAAQAEAVANGVEHLEQNWNGPLLQNTGIAPTLAGFLQLHPAGISQNWRWDSLLYRATYDRYVQVKRARELQAEDAALAALANEGAQPSARMAAARERLATTSPAHEETELHQALATLAASLFHECGLQLSVPLYGASNWERGANFDRVDTPLNDRVWIEQQLRAAEALHGPAQSQKLTEIVHWSEPAPGALYDDLGDPTAEPHLVRGLGWQQDPELYRTASDGIADKTLEGGWRFSWLDYAETLYEQPLQMHYSGLKPGSAYTLRVTYAGEDYKLPMQLTANGTVLHTFRLRQGNPEQIQVGIDAKVIRNGELTLQWQRNYGAGGGGRGGQVAEVWLWPDAGKPSLP